MAKMSSAKPSYLLSMPAPYYFFSVRHVLTFYSHTPYGKGVGYISLVEQRMVELTKRTLSLSSNDIFF
ncbi:regulatory protein [Histoplasma capsulatum]|uniref:Regulatory protein n=1 Tax=Ajellomyces capsulatus TaxID=5037 RepID=A0A8A1MFH8_AJECA|nr:regulatory protein [Histoplasma capsulatum]